MEPGSRAKQAGRLRHHPRFASRYLSTGRDLVVYLPPGYDESDCRCPVLYMQDGQNLFDPETAFGGKDWLLDITADRLICSGNIPPLIIVGIYNTGVRRISEYTPTRDQRRRKGGKADRYAQMLARELKPFIDREYRTLKGAQNTGVGGSSLGALVSLETGLLYPKTFGNLAVLSPSVWWDNRAILRLVQAWDAKPHPRIWLDTGTQEGDEPAQVVDDARVLRDDLIAKGWRLGDNLRYSEIEGAGHNEDAWAARFGLTLEYMFGTVNIRQPSTSEE